jgi:hypothetical protein
MLRTADKPIDIPNIFTDRLPKKQTGWQLLTGIRYFNLRRCVISSAGANMTQFGKRVAVGHAVSPNRPGGRETDVAAALAVVKAGKLPSWTTLGPIKLVIGVLIFAAGLYFITVKYAGDIVRDIRLAGTWQVAYDLQAFDGSCTRHNFVVTLCSAKIRSKAELNQAPLESQFMMLFSGGGGEMLVPVRSTKDPSAIAIAYAAETKLTNRSISFLVMTITLAAMLIGLVSALASGRYKGGAAHLALLDAITELKVRAESTQTLSRTT